MRHSGGSPARHALEVLVVHLGHLRDWWLLLLKEGLLLLGLELLLEDHLMVVQGLLIELLLLEVI